MKSLVKTLLTLLSILSLAVALVGCGDADVEDIVGDLGIGDIIGGEDTTACQHVYTAWAIYEDGECQERVYKRTCSLCRKDEIKQGSESDHTFSEWESRTATCTEDGGEFRKCTSCGKTESQNVIKAKDHRWTKIRTTEPTCTQNGSIIYACKNCDEARIEPNGTATGHDHSYISYDNNHHYSYCSRCGLYNSDPHYFGWDNVCYICGFANADSAPMSQVTIWVPEWEGSYELFEKQVLEFQRIYGYDFSFEISSVNPIDAGYYVVNDLAFAPDLYCFNQDQIDILVQACALAAPSYDSLGVIINSNDEASVLSAYLNGDLYAYPMSTSNGFYMYYDPNVITNPESLEQIIADCEAAGRTFSFELCNGWYNASFFMATGCISSWTTDSNGEFIDVFDSYNSDAGLIAMKTMQKLAQSPCHDDSSWISSDTAVIIAGIWMDDDAEYYGLVPTDLPSFIGEDGNEYHLGSYSGHYLMGVKPQTNSDRAEMLDKLALYLTSYDCQMERYLIGGSYYTPCNLQAQQTYEVQSNPAVAALLKQAEYAVPQRRIHGGWWDVSAHLGYNLEYATAEDLLYALIDYEQRVYELLYK